MNQLEKLQAICDEALQVAERSQEPQQTTICALVSVINMMIEHNKETKEKSLNYVDILRDGHNLPKHKIIAILAELACFEGL